MDVIQVSRLLPSLETFTQIHPQTLAVGCEQTYLLSAPRPGELEVQDLTTVWMLKGILALMEARTSVPVIFISSGNEGAVKPFGLALYLGLLNFLSFHLQVAE